MKLIKKVTLVALILACIAACLPGLQLPAAAADSEVITIEAGTTLAFPSDEFVGVLRVLGPDGEEDIRAGTGYIPFLFAWEGTYKLYAYHDEECVYTVEVVEPSSVTKEVMISISETAYDIGDSVNFVLGIESHDINPSDIYLCTYRIDINTGKPIHASIRTGVSLDGAKYYEEGEYVAVATHRSSENNCLTSNRVHFVVGDPYNPTIKKRTVEAGTTVAFCHMDDGLGDVSINRTDGMWTRRFPGPGLTINQTFVWEGTYEIVYFNEAGSQLNVEIVEVVAPTDKTKDITISMPKSTYAAGENVSFTMTIDPFNSNGSDSHRLQVYQIDPGDEKTKYDVLRTVWIGRSTEVLTFDKVGQYVVVATASTGGSWTSSRLFFEIVDPSTTTKPTTAKPTTKPVTTKPQGNQNSCATGHTYENGSCKNCGITDPNYDPCANGHRFENGYCVVCFAPETQATPTTKPSLPTSKPATQSVSQTTVHPVTLPSDYPVPDGGQTPAKGWPIGWLLLAIALALILVFVIFGAHKTKKKKSATPVTPEVPPVVPVAGVRAGGGTKSGAAGDPQNPPQQ